MVRFLRQHDEFLSMLTEGESESLVRYLLGEGAAIWGMRDEEMGVFVPTRTGNIDVKAMLNGTEVIDPEGMFLVVWTFCRVPGKRNQVIDWARYTRMAKLAFPRCEYWRWYNRRRKKPVTVRL